MLLSDEQKVIVDAVQDGYNVIVDAVAGCGKTTTCLNIADVCHDKSILLLTYNSGLKNETRNKVLLNELDNMEVHSYHSFCVKYYHKTCYDDLQMYRFLNDIKSELEVKFSYDIIILDEQQDMKPLFFELVNKIISDNKLNPQICLFGDIHQNIYSFAGSNEKYLTHADEYIESSNEWKRLKINTTFRITDKMADFMNTILLNDKRLITTKIGSHVKYLICDPYKPIPIINLIENYLNNGYKYDDIFILAPSIKSKKTPIMALENRCVKKNYPCYVSNDDSIDEDIMKGKIVFTTFHKSKGLERKIVIVYNFDSSLYYYSRDAPKNKCPNNIYVAATRALEELIVIHSEQQDYLPFINKMILSDYCEISGSLAIKKAYDKQINPNLILNKSVTDLIKGLNVDKIINVLDHIKYDIIKEPSKKIELNSKLLCNELYEDISAINGTAIPAYYEYLKTGSSYLYDRISCIDDLLQCQQDKINDILDRSTKLTISDFLYMTILYDSYTSGYTHKLEQIDNYNWFDTPSELSKLKRMLKNINNNIIANNQDYEVPISKLISPNERLNGIIDCIDNESKTVWEFKTTSYISESHILQFALYAFLCSTIYPNYNYCILNILSGEVIKLDMDNTNLDKMIECIQL